MHTFGDHDDVVQAVLDRADALGAQLVVVGRKGRVSARATDHSGRRRPRLEESRTAGANEEA